MLAFKISFLTSAFGVSAPTFAATAAATLSFVVSTTGFASAFGATSTFSPALVVLSTVVLFDTSSAACTAPAPKKILAPTTTDAVPTLNFLIEYDSTFVPCLVSFKYWLFFPTIIFLLYMYYFEQLFYEYVILIVPKETKLLGSIFLVVSILRQITLPLSVSPRFYIQFSTILYLFVNISKLMMRFTHRNS